MKYTEIKALSHLLERAEEYERAKRRLADIPEALRNRNLTVGAEQMRLNVAAGTWVRVRKCSPEQIEEMLLRYDLALDGIRKLAHGKFNLKALRAFVQDLIATLEPPQEISENKN